MSNLLSFWFKKSSSLLAAAALHLPHGKRLGQFLGAGLLALGSPLVTQGAIALESPDTTPAAVVNTIRAIETAANDQDLEGVMAYYATDFRHSDGLNRDSFQQILSQVWEQYPDLQYETEILGWQSTDQGVVVETKTTITGMPEVAGRPFTYVATLTSEQRFNGEQIVEQRMLSEASELTAGDNPPNVIVNLPDSVLIGRSFYFDAFMVDPLGNRRLLGAAINEPANLEGYLEPPQVNFELLSAGGLFKIGEAPTVPGHRWISGLLVHEEGITVMTRRLAVTSPGMINPSQR
jgi:hypothetical protein